MRAQIASYLLGVDLGIARGIARIEAGGSEGEPKRGWAHKLGAVWASLIPRMQIRTFVRGVGHNERSTGEGIMNAGIRITTSANAARDRAGLLQGARLSEKELRKRAKKGTLDARHRALLRRLNALEYVESGALTDLD